MKKGTVFCFVIFQRYSNYYKFGDVTGGCNMEPNKKLQNISGKNGLKTIETWHQYCDLPKTQDGSYCDVNLATILTRTYWQRTHTTSTWY